MADDPSRPEEAEPRAPSGNGSRPPAPREGLRRRLERLSPGQRLDVLLEAWAGLHGAPTLAFWLPDSESITRETADEVFEALSPLRERVPALWVVLHSLGGDLHGAYPIARRLQEAAARVGVVIPRMAKSAATLITLGCHEVVMHPMAELGPIDTQTVMVRSDTKRMLSTLDALKSLEYLREYAITTHLDLARAMSRHRPELTFKAASQISTGVMEALIDALYSSIDPIQVGEVFRALDTSREYGRRLLAESYQERSDEERARLLAALAEGYPSHGFVIDLQEARALGLKVRAASPEELPLLDPALVSGAREARAVRLQLPPAGRADDERRG